jgi:hypothetical protein
MSVDQMSVDQMSVDQMSVDQMSVDQMSVDQISVDQMSVCQAPVSPIKIDQMSVSQISMGKCQWANCLSTKYHQSNDYWLSDAYGPNVCHELMEEHTLKNVNSCLNTNISSYLETSVVKVLIYISMSFIFSTPVLIRHLRKLKTVVFLHWCLIFLHRDIWRSKFNSIFKCHSFFQHQC